MLLQILILLLLISGVLIFFGFYLKKDWHYLGIAGSVILIVTGLVLISSPLEYQSGSTIIQNENTWVITTDYSSPSNPINEILDIVISSGGLFLFIINIISIRRIKDERKYSEDED